MGLIEQPDGNIFLKIKWDNGNLIYYQAALWGSYTIISPRSLRHTQNVLGKQLIGLGMETTESRGKL